MKTIQFLPNSHDKVFNCMSDNGNFYNDDIDLVSNKDDDSSTIAVFTHKNGLLTGIKVPKSKYSDEIVEMFKSITE